MIDNEVRIWLKKICEALNQCRVEYLVVGGTAVAFHGYSRISGITTKQPQITVDLDFWYKPTQSNYTNLIAALTEIGVDTSTLSNLVFDPKKTFLKIPRPNFHLDFLPVMTGLDSFSMCKTRAKKINLDGNNVYILGYTDLIKNKLAVGRPGDIGDIENLSKQ